MDWLFIKSSPDRTASQTYIKPEFVGQEEEIADALSENIDKDYKLFNDPIALKGNHFILITMHTYAL